MIPHKNLRVVGFPNPSGSAWWRLRLPFKELQKVGIDARVSEEGITTEIAEWGDIFVLQGCTDRDGIALLYEYQQEHGKKLVVEADDNIKIDDHSPFKLSHDVNHAPEVIARTMEIADLITTTTPYLANRLKELNPKVCVLPNYLDMDLWDMPSKKNTSDTIRIGWAGSLTHMKDLELVVEPLRRICQEFPNVRLIFCGEMRIANLLRGLPVECML